MNTLNRNERHFGRVAEGALLIHLANTYLALYDQAGMALIVLFASQAALSNSSYALRLENNSLRQVRVGLGEPAMTEQHVEFPVVIFAH